MLIAEGRMPVSPEANTRYLTALAQKEISQVQVGTQPWRDITPDQALPNAVLFGAYFDGRHIYPIEESTVRLDPADRALRITLSADRPSYQPGDTAALHLTVTDAQGQPVPNARLAISVVDDARYMLEPPDVAVLSELYRPAYTPTISDYASLTQHNLFCIVHVSPEIEEKPPIRYPYASQTASQLISAVTGPDGRAAVRLHLGETAAKWYVTAIGITDDLRAGTGDLCLDAPLPFALEARQFISYFDGSLQVTAQASGTAVTLDAPITYQCVLTGPGGVIQTEQAASKGHTLQTFDLGRPPAGQYTLHVTARCGEHEAQQILDVTIEGDASDARLAALS